MPHADPISARPERNWFIRNHRKIVATLAIILTVAGSVPVSMITLSGLTGRAPGWEGWQRLPVAGLIVLLELVLFYFYVTARSAAERKTMLKGMIFGGVGLALLLNELEHVLLWHERNGDVLQLGILVIVSSLPNVAQFIVIHFASKIFEGAEISASEGTNEATVRTTNEAPKPVPTPIPTPRPQPTPAPKPVPVPTPTPKPVPTSAPAPQSNVGSPAANVPAPATPAPSPTASGSTNVSDLSGRAAKLEAAKEAIRKIIEGGGVWSDLYGSALEKRFAGEPFHRSIKSWENARGMVLQEMKATHPLLIEALEKQRIASGG